MRMFLAPPDTRPRPVPIQVQEVRRLLTAREVFQDRFGLTYHQAAFLAALYHDARRAGLNRAKIVEATGISRETVLSAYVRTRQLGVEHDGQLFWIGDGLRAACVQALAGDRGKP